MMLLNHMQMCIRIFKMVAHTVVEQHDLVNKPDTVHCVNKSYYVIKTHGSESRGKEAQSASPQ